MATPAKKYQLIYDNRPGKMHKVVINTDANFSQDRYEIEISSHRNFSQLGNCTALFSKVDREMVFGDIKCYLVPYATYRQKMVGEVRSRIFSSLSFKNKLFRFVRS